MGLSKKKSPANNDDRDNYPAPRRCKGLPIAATDVSTPDGHFSDKAMMRLRPRKRRRCPTGKLADLPAKETFFASSDEIRPKRLRRFQMISRRRRTNYFLLLLLPLFH